MDSLIPAGRIEHRIFLIRGQKVMLDGDLARLYGVETRILNQAVKRNSERFPEDFMFRLIRAEIRRVSQIVIPSDDSNAFKYSNRVSAFTEHGVAMLSSVLNSPQAIQVNIQIMRAFAKMRKIMAANTNLSRRLNRLERQYDTRFREVFDAIRRLTAPLTKSKRRIGFQP